MEIQPSDRLQGTFHDISELNPAEIEETVKCHVQVKIDEYGIDATIIDAAVAGGWLFAFYIAQNYII